ncbi:glycosyltransferase family 4 protein [bacterium]|nr:glycosyltransferase family 4 protein [bacterium]
MKILFVFINEFGQFSDIFEYATLLSEQGYQVAYLGLSNVWGIQEASFASIELHHLPRQDFPGLLTRLHAMAKAIDDIGADIVHVFHFRGCGLLPLLSRHRSTRWILDVRTLHVENKKHRSSSLSVLKERITWLEAQTYDKVVALTEKIASTLRPSFRDVTIIPLGASVQRLNPPNREQIRSSIRQKWGLSDSDNVILYAGSISPSRRLPVLLEAFELLTRTHDDVRLIVVGAHENTAFLENLKAQAERLGILDRIVFTGRVPYNEVFPYYCAADIGVSMVPTATRHRYQPPTKLIEYLACANLIPVATCTPASLDYVQDGVNGFVCLDSVEDVHNALGRAISAYGEPASFASIREHADRVAACNDWAVIVSQYLIPLYRTLRQP